MGHKYQGHPSTLAVKEKYKDLNFSFSSISLSNLQNELNSLDSSKSVHEIDIPTIVLKANMDILSPFLLNYFNNLVDSLSFQSYLKLANLTLVHKKDSRNDKKNYRSVSEFEKLRAIRASVGGVGNVLVWVTYLRGWHASVGSVGGVLA